MWYLHEDCVAKVRLNWNLFSDKDTKIFHTYAMIKIKTRLISSLKIDNHMVTYKCEMENHIEKHSKYVFNKVSILQDNGMID